MYSGKNYFNYNYNYNSNYNYNQNNNKSSSFCDTIKKPINKVRQFVKNHPYIALSIIVGIFVFLIIIIAIAVSVKKKKKNKDDNDNNLISFSESEINAVLNIYKKIGSNDDSTLEVFCNYVKESCSKLNEKQKVYFTYYWVAHKIKYDVVNYYAGTPSDCLPSSFFPTKTTVCSGYSRLFTHLLKCMDYTEDKIHNVIGYAKTDEDIDTLDDSNHEWNMVQIDDKHCLIDSTWGAGNTNSKKQFVADYDEYYLCTPPIEFIRTHLPEENDSNMQLLNPTITFSQFINMAQTSKYFFKLGFTSIDPDLNKQNICGEGKITLKYETNERPILFTKLIKSGNEVENSFMNKKITNGYDVSFYINNVGTYTLQIYSNKGEYTTLPLTVQFTITCQTTQTSKKYYPIFYNTYEKSDMELISPLDGELKSGNKYNFQVKSSEESLVVYYNGQWTDMNKNGNTFTANNVLVQGSNEVCYILNNDGNVFVKYTIK